MEVRRPIELDVLESAAAAKDAAFEFVLRISLWWWGPHTQKSKYGAPPNFKRCAKPAICSDESSLPRVGPR